MANIQNNPQSTTKLVHDENSSSSLQIDSENAMETSVKFKNDQMKFVAELEKKINDLKLENEKLQREKLLEKKKSVEEIKSLRDENEKLKIEIRGLNEKLILAEKVEKSKTQMFDEKVENLKFSHSILFLEKLAITEKIKVLKEEKENLFEDLAKQNKQLRHFKRLAVYHNQLKRNFKNVQKDYEREVELREEAVEDLEKFHKKCDELEKKKKILKDEKKKLSLKFEKIKEEVKVLREKLNMEDTENNTEQKFYCISVFPGKKENLRNERK